MDRAEDTRAQLRKSVLRAMRNDIKARLKEAQADLEAVNRLIAVQEEIEPPPAPASVSKTRKASIAILEEKGQPMHRMDLLKELEDSGIRIGGKVPVNNLGSILSRFDEDFKPHGQGIWGLKAWDSGPSSSESDEPNARGTATQRGPLGAEQIPRMLVKSDTPTPRIPFKEPEPMPPVVVKEDLPW